MNGDGFTIERIKRDCSEVEFAERTPDDRLRSGAFVCLRDNKNASEVAKEM